MLLTNLSLTSCKSPGTTTATSSSTETTSTNTGPNETTLSETTLSETTLSETTTGTESSDTTDLGTSSAGPTDSDTAISDTTTESETDDDTIIELVIEPVDATVTVASGWSFPVTFTVTGTDGQGDPVAVDPTWSIAQASLGTVTAKGGTFHAHNTAAGTTAITVTAAGLEAATDVTVVIDESFPTCPPRPPLTEGEPSPGAFVKVVAPEYEGTEVYHGVYLPPTWQPGRVYPVIVESPPNQYGSFTGKVDDASLGYYLAGCRNFIWVVVPYIEGQANLDFGWGMVDTAITYWETNVARVLATYGGDPGAVIISGFSRGAIGTSYMGLHHEQVADRWLGFFMHSHADVETNLTPDQGAGSMMRMQRIAGRNSFLSWGAVNDGGQVNSEKGVDLLTGFGYPFTTLAVPDVGHTDTWLADDPQSRQLAQQWLFETLAARTGTHHIRGRVTDGQGEGIEAVRVTSGTHQVVSDNQGYYRLEGLVPGVREVTCTHQQMNCSPQQVDISDADADGVDFVLP